MFKVLGKTVHILFVLVLLSIVGLLLTTMLPIPGNFEVKIVKSGSMEPSINTGGIVVTRPSGTYRVGDVITFENKSSDIPTTHRIVSVREAEGETLFMTKGDANEDADTEEVAEGAVLGKVLFDVPYAGYVLDFSRQPMGFALLVGLPALLIVFDEITKIWREVKKIRSGRRDVAPQRAGTLRIERRKLAPVSLQSKKSSATRFSLPAVPMKPRRILLRNLFKRTPRTEMVSVGSNAEVHYIKRMMDIGHPIIMQIVEPKTPRTYVLSPKKHSGLIAASLTMFVLGGLFVSGLGQVGSTLSYPIDVETSTGNTLVASGDFNQVLRAAELNTLFVTEGSDNGTSTGTSTESDGEEKKGGGLGIQPLSIFINEIEDTGTSTDPETGTSTGSTQESQEEGTDAEESVTEEEQIVEEDSKEGQIIEDTEEVTEEEVVEEEVTEEEEVQEEEPEEEVEETEEETEETLEA